MSTSLPGLGLPESLPADLDARRSQAKADSETLRAAFSSSQLRRDNIDWVVTGFLTFVHLGALLALVPAFFSWQGLAICAVMHWMTCSIGICLGYHRYLSHKAFKLRTPAEFVVMLIGTLSGEGSPLTWAATHRLHHQKSDQDGDPHSPITDGPWWSHILWLFIHRKEEDKALLFRRYVPELLTRPMMKFFERTFPLWLWAQGLVLLAAGWAMGGWVMGVSFVVWGLCVRMVFAYHSTWFVNSATHLWGYRNYDTRDHSRNLWWVAVLAYGEGWHNNHHAHPSVAPAGHRWWEVDMTWWAIRALQMTGLAYDVKSKIPVGRSANDIEPEPGMPAAKASIAETVG
ncbi:MAG: fatty acid desaturase [Planctomycetaceae bacterium]